MLIRLITALALKSNHLGGNSSSSSNKVVLLIDEFDKPVTENLANPENCEAIQKILKNFLAPLKSKDKYF